MEFFKKILGLFILVIVFLAVTTNLPKFLSSATKNSTDTKWYDSTYYLNEYYLADSKGNSNIGTGYQYYLADSQYSPVINSGNLAYAGTSYYDSDYRVYAPNIYAQYNNFDSGYVYYKEYKSRDGFDEAWEKYVLNK